VQDCNEESPQVEGREKSERSKPREREDDKKSASGGTGLDDRWIETETESPVGLKIQGNFEAETRADDSAKSEDQWDGDQVSGQRRNFGLVDVSRHAS
jgi:hypothetical protein